MVNLVIDGKNVVVPEDTTILETARQYGIDIPALCYHPRLRPLGHCRMCLVEIEGAAKPMAACETPVLEGMVVYTDTPRIQEMRRGILEMAIAAHPVNGCYVCDRSGNCEFQNFVYSQSLEGCSFATDTYGFAAVKDNPFIVRDYEKCILCGRCVAVCQEVQGRFVYDLVGKGFQAKIAPTADGTEVTAAEAGCVYCGQCVQVCPVGALVERNRRYQVREWEMHKVSSICSYCGVGCNLELYVKDNQIVKVMGRDNPEVNEGWLCVKGCFGYDYVHSPERLITPLIREGEKGKGLFRPATWDEALDRVAAKLQETRRTAGPDAIGVVCSAKCTNEENYLLQKMARAVIGTNNIDHCARLCHASTVAGLATAFGSGAMTNSIGDVDKAGCILVSGSNTTENHPVIAQKIKAAVRFKGAKLIVADPREIELAGLAHLWLRQRPGTDLTLLNSMLQVIIEEKLFDADFIENRTENFAAVKEAVAKYTPESVAEITGVPAEDIRQAARMYATGPRSSIYYDLGITQHTSGAGNVLALANLAMACGQVGKEGAGVNPLRGQNNMQGACDMGGLPNVYTAYQPVTDENIRLKFARAWGRELPDKPGFTLVEMLEAVQEGKVKALYIMGENPVVTGPDAEHAEKALASLDFLVVQDIFLTETARYADVILPSTAFAEKEGTFTNTERRVQKLEQALTPPGEAKPDWWIIQQVAQRMGYAMNYFGPADIMAEINSLTPSYAGITYRRLTGSNGLQWPCPDENHPGTRFLHSTTFTRGRGKFNVVEYRPPAEEPNDEYPFVLTTGRVHYHYHATLSHHSKLKEVYPEPAVEINAEDALRLGIRSGDRVKLSSRHDELVVKAEVTPRVKTGVVFLNFHFPAARVNRLIGAHLDPVAKIPEYKAAAVKVEKVE